MYIPISLNDNLDKVFVDICKLDPIPQQRATRALRDYASARESSVVPGSPEDWEEEVGKRLVGLIQSSHSDQKLGAIRVIDVMLKLMREDPIDNRGSLYRLYNYLTTLLRGAQQSNILVSASKSLGKLVEISDSVLGDRFVEDQIPNFLETISSNASPYGAVLALKELAQNSPTSFFPHLSSTFETVSMLLHNSQYDIRRTAAELMGAILAAMRGREFEIYIVAIKGLQRRVRQGLEGKNSAAVLHGSLLALRELFLYAGQIMNDVFIDTWIRVNQFRTHSDSEVRHAMFELVPALAGHDPKGFCEQGFLGHSMSFLLPRLDSNDAPFAYLSIGNLSSALGPRLNPYIDSIFDHIRVSLKLHQRRDSQRSDYVFQAIALLATSLGPSISPAINQQLDLMFSCDLNQSLIQMFESIVRHIPILLRPIQDRLLQKLSLVLSGEHFRPLGSPRKQIGVEDVKGSTPISNSSLVVLALDVLGKFDFEGHLLSELILTTVLPHLDDEDDTTRKVAAFATCRLIARDPVRYQTSHHAVEMLGTILDKVLSVGVVDPDPDVRKTVLASLEMRLDLQLAQGEYIRLLLIALHDEIVENRILAINVIGRLADKNPAQVVPPLRRTLFRLLTELRYSPTPHGKEVAVRMLAALITSTHAVVENRVADVLKVLLQCSSEQNPVVASYVLHCIGQLSAASARDVVGNVPHIMSLILTSLEGDRRSTRLTAALGCLGHLCTNCAYVISPIEEHPQLIPLLYGLLKRERSVSIRRQVIRVIGLLGAMDPNRMVRAQGIVDMEYPPEKINIASPTDKQTTTSTADSTNSMPGVANDPYQVIVIDLLVDTLQQPSFSSHRHLAIDSLMSIAKTRGMAFAKFVPKILPSLSAIIRSSAANLQSYYLTQLASLIGIIKHHARICVTDIMDLVHEVWDTSAQHLALVALVEALSSVLASDFRTHVSRLLPRLLLILQSDRTDTLYPTQTKVLKALVSIGSNLEPYLNLVVPAVIRTYERVHSPQTLRRQAIESLAELSGPLELYPYTSRIMHSLVNLMIVPDDDVRKAASDALRTLAYRLGSSFKLFVPLVVKAVEVNKVADTHDLLLVCSRLLHDEDLPHLDPVPQLLELPPEGANLSPNQNNLKQAWDVSRVQERPDSWVEWFTHLVAQLVKESTSISLRSCMNLFEAYPHISVLLINPAFASCWSCLTDANKDSFICSIEYVVSSISVPAEVAHSMLNLIEYMERNEAPLPIPNGSLAKYCFDRRAYAKALHYQELHFFQNPSATAIEVLVETNAMLRQEDAALGTLNLARQSFTVQNSEEWYEKLGQWNDALELYRTKQDVELYRPTSFIGQLRCLHALGEWEQVTGLISEKWSNLDGQIRAELAPLGAAASWHMGDWDTLDIYSSVMRRDSPDRAFYRAISSIHKNSLSRAVTNINMARDLLDPELTALLDENPDGLHQFTVRAQIISELEEIVSYKGLANQPERQRAIRETWKKRLLGCQRDLDVWQRILKVRTLAIRPEDDTETIVRFANLCRKSQRLGAAARATQDLIHPGENGDKAPPEVVYAKLKILWASGDQETAFDSLRKFTHQIARDSESKGGVAITGMLARCHFKYGNWRMEMDGGITARSASTILLSHHQATVHDPKWSKAWHAWALSNLEIVRNSSSTEAEPHPASDISHIVAAIDGFFHSIYLMNRDKLQDTLRLLTLWFRFGFKPEVTFAMSKGFRMVACDTWLEVVPQIIARIQTTNPVIREALTNLLIDLGQEHPQALVYPLTVGAKSQSKPRKSAALNILDRMCTHSWTLVEQAKLVGRELTRVAITWSEHWHEALQTSAKHYFSGKPDAMIEALQPLYEELERGPSTVLEKEFSETVGPLLLEARELCRQHLVNKDQTAFDKAWAIQLQVWQKLNKNLPEVTSPVRPRHPRTIDLHYVSLELLRAVNLELAVPGTYLSGRPVVKISNFKREIPILSSKQRPRRLVIVGNDGNQYVFLLKGHDDLRQDERVIQVIGLVNKLLSRERKSLNRKLHLQRYPVIPLAPDVGLVAWMDGTDTLHHVISDYRKPRRIKLDLEYSLMLQEEPDYENAPLARKVSVFESVMDKTTGQDLYRILWLKSESSEAWVSRRSTYTRSLAVGSMVGYLLGVGDRHPANIMLGRKTGKIIHIDFGDCFEVALQRDKLPEKIPFRLTRMLRNAMEVSGIQGGFKIACEISMVVLRENKESLLAVLEALVYDPLINWRLVRSDKQETETTELPSSLSSTSTGPARRTMINEDEILDDTDLTGTNREVRNERALEVYNRVLEKLTGRDFDPDRSLPVSEQVERLVQEAVSTENLCELFHGWSAFW